MSQTNLKVLAWFQIIIILSGIWQLEDAQKVKNQEIAKELSLPPVKLHCSSKFFNITYFRRKTL